jgi:L-fuconolactonase
LTRIDSHQHFWKIARGDYPWLSKEAHPKIYRDFEPADLEPLLRKGELNRTILVQAAPTLGETEYLLELARRTSFVAGVVGWADFEASNVVAVLEKLSANKLLVGMRPMIQDLPDDDWILSSDIAPVLRAISQAQLRFDALVKPRHLPILLRLLDRNPDLQLVIDHGAKPMIRSGEISTWSSAIRDLARETSACCKLSGLITEAVPDWSVEQLKPFVEILLESFGPDRLMWGSDWPVLTEAGDYESWLSASESLTRSLDEEDRGAIFGGTAARFYGIAA